MATWNDFIIEAQNRKLIRKSLGGIVLVRLEPGAVDPEPIPEPMPITAPIAVASDPGQAAEGTGAPAPAPLG